MIPGLSWPEIRIKPVNCEIFSLGIGSDYPLLALSEVSFILMSAILNLEELSVRRGDKTILGPLSWQVLEGQRWVVLGPNGAGKTTLLQICASLIHPTTGKIEILGQQLGKVDVFELRTRIGLTSSALVEQLPSDELVIDAVLTAAYAVLGRWQEKYDLWDESRAMALLTALGVSEGEKKRVQIARALMADPELLLLDEPASSLDLGGREDLLKRIEVFAKDPLAPATVIVTHHIEEIPVGTSHALLLKDGEVVASGDVNQVITDENLTLAYGLPISVQSQNGRFFARAR
jgi:iron complex transport system ATP-binding protein